MNCPNCNKEISPDWELCPFCRYVPKKCSNTTHPPRWLPQEARFCPECGEPLDSNGEVMTPPSPPTVPKERKVSVGDILCTDNTTVPVSEWPAAGKTAMGVVFFVDDTGKHGWAVHLQDQGKHRWTQDGIRSKVEGMCIYGREKLALADEDGYANTRALRAAGNASMYPAAYAVDFESGWYLPALGQLKTLYDRRKAINVILKQIYGTILDGWFWSSTQKSRFDAWDVTYFGYASYFSKNHAYKVRSVRAF